MKNFSNLAFLFLFLEILYQVYLSQLIQSEMVVAEELVGLPLVVPVRDSLALRLL
jgi:hypothetical protein